MTVKIIPHPRVRAVAIRPQCSVCWEDVFFFFCKYSFGALKSLLLTKGRRLGMFNTQSKPGFLPLLTSCKCWQAFWDTVPCSPCCALHTVKCKLTWICPFTFNQSKKKKVPCGYTQFPTFLCPLFASGCCVFTFLTWLMWYPSNLSSPQHACISHRQFILLLAAGGQIWSLM